MASVILLRLLILPVILVYGLPEVAPPGKYRAAVLENNLINPPRIPWSRWEALTQAMPNLKVYRKYAAMASAKNVDILVFSEAGLYGWEPLVNRKVTGYFAENIPDPNQVTWNPCDQPRRFTRVEIQISLSCLAKENGLYVVANIGDIDACSPDDPECPSDKQFLFNTNVVYDRRGRFIARYHKFNLYKEPPHNQPVSPEYVYFDNTEFGRFGNIICFDAMFHNPVITLIEEYNITNIVFPNAWPQEFPYYIPISYHSAFAVLHGINFLSANLRYLPGSAFGSGIYTPDGDNVYRYDSGSTESKLLISDVDRNPKGNMYNRWGRCDNSPIRFGAAEMRFLVPIEFKSVTFYDWTDYVALTSSSGQVTICKNGFCCFLMLPSHQRPFVLRQPRPGRT